MRQTLKSKLDEKPVKRVALYLRSSSLAQVTDGYGLESQERILRSYVDANAHLGWITNDSLVFREDGGIPGNIPASERPELSKLVAEIEAGRVDIVAVWKLDRIFRKTALMLNFVDFLVEKEVVFVSRVENIDMSTEVGRMILTIFAAMAEVERSTIASRTREGKISKAKDGYIVYGSVVPYGYRKIEAGRGYKLGVDQEEAEVVREIFSMYADDGYGTGEIARILTARGIGTNIDRRKKNGEALPHEKIHQDLFRQDTVRRILQNSVYIGEYTCNKYLSVQKNGKTIQKLKDETEWITIPCEPIVDQDLFNRAQDLLVKTHVIRGRGESHIFTGLIKCSECGRSFNYYKSHKGTGQYRCGGKKKDKVSKENLCTNRDISEMKIMEVVWPQIENFLRHPKEFLKHYEQLLQDDGTAKRRKDVEIKHARVIAEIAEKKVHHKNALRREMEGGDSAEAYGAMAIDYLEEIKNLETLRNTLASDLKTYEKREEAMNAVLERSNEYHGKLAQITDEQKGALVREFVYQIELSRLDGVVEFMFEKA